MKNFLLRLFLFVILLALVFVPFNVLVDPYNVFHAKSIRYNGVEPNKNYIKTKHVIDHKDDYDSYLFGSSRAGFIDVSKLPDGNWYNLSYSEGLPKEQTRTLEALIANGEIPKQVYLSLDNISFLVDPAYHKDQLLRKEYPFAGSVTDKLSFFLSYLDSVMTLESLSVIGDYPADTEDLRERIYSNGCENLNAERIFNSEDNKAYWEKYYSPRVDEAVEEIREFCNLCEEYDIKLVVFTNPLYVTTYERSVENGYLDFLLKLSEVTDYYNFSSYNRISMDKSYYFETSHFTPEAAEIMMDIIENGGSTEEEMYAQVFGKLITKENAAECVQMLYFQAYVTGLLDYEETVF